MEALLIFLSVVAVAVWLGWPKHKPKPAAPKEQPMTDLDQWAIEHGRLLVEQINESIKIANESKNVDTKFSRIGVAREKAAELRDLAGKFTFLRIERTDEVVDTLRRIESEAQEMKLSSMVAIDYPTAHIGMAKANADIVNGLRFSATLQMRTPLAVLKKHGKIHASLTDPPPTYAKEGWEGVWIPALKSWKELGGVDLPEFTPGAASDIGTVTKPDHYCKFLVALKTLASERGVPIEERRRNVLAEAGSPEWRDYTERHGGASAVVSRVFGSL